LVQIAPFRAVHYNNLRFGNEVGRLVAPPYDVIDHKTEMSLKEDRLNIAHLILGDEGDAYATVAKRARRWLNDEVLVRDGGESLYIYEQTFQGRDGVVRVRSGIVALVKLEEFSKGMVLPHEGTIPGHKADRMALMRAIGGDTEQIFMLYDDPSGEVEELLGDLRKSDEIIRFIDQASVHHRIIRISDRGTVERLKDLLAPQRALIADGHHRYETALEYRDERRRRDGDGGERMYDYVLATLVSFKNPGLVVNPTHRLINDVPDDVLSSLEDLLGRDFRLTHLSTPDEVLERLEDAPDSAFGVWCPATGLTALAEQRRPRRGGGPLERLSVFVLQENILKGILGFTQDMISRKENIDYVKELEDAKTSMESGEHRLCLLTKAPSVAQIMTVAAGGDKLPPKSTYFSPKIWSGTLLHLFDQ
jgi:uncharacterized protein (DUF1015 family)